MLVNAQFLGSVAFLLIGVRGQTVDKCPTKTEYACFDVINSSLCISQNAAGGTAEAMAKCVEYNGTASNLPGSTKVWKTILSCSKENDYVANNFGKYAFRLL